MKVLNNKQKELLAAIKSCPKPPTVLQLARVFRVTKQTMSERLFWLKKRGLVETFFVSVPYGVRIVEGAE
jgi:DNA-binding MarR family transcriptional regulator